MLLPQALECWDYSMYHMAGHHDYLQTAFETSYIEFAVPCIIAEERKQPKCLKIEWLFYHQYIHSMDYYAAI
jgi:hypothetical protein